MCIKLPYDGQANLYKKGKLMCTSYSLIPAFVYGSVVCRSKREILSITGM